MKRLFKIRFYKLEREQLQNSSVDNLTISFVTFLDSDCPTVTMIIVKALALLLVICGSSGWIFFLYWLSGPDDRLQLPRDLKHLSELKGILEEYAENQKFYSLIFFASIYLYKQSFAIPGSVFLNLMAGALFGVWKGSLLVCCLSATGASCCFLLSQLFGKELMNKYVPHRIAYFQKMVEKSREEAGLFKLMLSLRIFPMSPNWLINMCSPLVGVPLRLFFLSVLIGLAPYNLLTVNAGATLSDLKSLDDIISWRVGIGLGLLALGILNPFKLVARAKTNCKKTRKISEPFS